MNRFPWDTRCRRSAIAIFRYLIATFLIIFMTSSGLFAATLMEIQAEKEANAYTKKTLIASNDIFKLMEIHRGRELPNEDSIRQLYVAGKESYDRQMKMNATFTIDEEFDYAIGRLLDAMLIYYQTAGQRGKTLEFLDIGVAEAKKHSVFSKYLKYQQQRIDTYLAFGQFDKARSAVKETYHHMMEVYDVVPSRGVDDYDEPALFAYCFCKQLEYKVVLASEEILPKESILETWRFIDETYRKQPILRLYSPVSLKMFALTNKHLPSWHERYLQMHGELFTELSRMLARVNEPEAARKALAVATAAYETNIRNLQRSNKGHYFRNTQEETLGFLLLWNENADKRPLILGQFLIPLYRAEIDAALGDYPAVARHLPTAREAFRKVDELYAKLPKVVVISDRIYEQELQLMALEAKNAEVDARYDEALKLYEKQIDRSEMLRQSIPVEQRLEFFRSAARQGYLGAIRCWARKHMQSGNSFEADQALAATEKLRARQLQELLGYTGKSLRAEDVALLRRKAGADSAIVTVMDVETHYLVGFLHESGRRIRLVEKNRESDLRLIAMRNELAEKKNFQRDLLARDFHELMGGWERDLIKFKKLYVIPDGAWSFLPWSLLPVENKLLADDTLVSYSPSLSMLVTSATPGVVEKTKPPTGVFVLADPQYKREERSKGYKSYASTRGNSYLGYFQSLPETRDEAEAIKRNFGQVETEVLMGEQAVKSAVRTMDLSHFSHLHFATHGVLAGELPNLQEPALVLAWEQNEDGLLTASEVAKLKLNADLAVLSACNTGNGKYFRGEGLDGLGRAFMIAGSKQVIVSLWPVDSIATTALMSELYRGLGKGISAGEALRLAQKSLRVKGAGKGAALAERGVKVVTTKAQDAAGSTSQSQVAGEYDNPFYWSPFILISVE